ncbi:Arabinose 5-phosphate isomerase [Enterobacter ludwigii]|uniref:Arabinose 5-phosphate isomerase n=2 Tax=Enterobacter ludwigii TaxID=299767 RepID=G8LGF4_9ENTR|nr:Arabinose 5-phosphate isomerase [Enterobacter ludwigii]
MDLSYGWRCCTGFRLFSLGKRKRIMSQIELQPGFDFQKAGKEVLEIEREGLAQLDQYINQDFSLACEKMFYCAGKVVVMGMGKSGHIGRKMAATFASTGTSSFFVHPGEAAHGDLGMVTPQDIVIALSNSGESNEILALIPVLKRLRVPLICMTSRPESSMARAADIHLCVKVPKEACPLGLAPTSSTTAALVMGDALAVALLEARGFTPEDFALSHPGGALGRKLLLRVNDIMHTGDEIPHVSKEASLRDALLEITRKNLGMTVVCDDLMKIQGIFTDGDLRRVFDMGVDVRTLGIADVMTSGGIRVRPGTLAVDVLNLMQSRHITSVMVADGDQLLGVVHMHDLLRAGVV